MMIKKIGKKEASNYQGHENIEKTFFREFDLKPTVLINSVSKTRFGNYIDLFTSLLSEFECVGGRRDNPIIHALFLSDIPEKYNSEKNTYRGKTVNEALDYFRHVSDYKLMVNLYLDLNKTLLYKLKK